MNISQNLWTSPQYASDPWLRFSKGSFHDKMENRFLSRSWVYYIENSLSWDLQLLTITRCFVFHMGFGTE